MSSETLLALARLNNNLLEQVVAYLGPRLALVPVVDDNLAVARRSTNRAERIAATRVVAALTSVTRRGHLASPDLETMTQRAVKNALERWDGIKGSLYRDEIAEQFAAVWYGGATAIAIGQESDLVNVLNGPQSTARFGPRVFGVHHLLAVLSRDSGWDAHQTWALVRDLHFNASPPHVRLKVFGGLFAFAGETERSALAFMAHGHLDVEF